MGFTLVEFHMETWMGHTQHALPDAANSEIRIWFRCKTGRIFFPEYIDRSRHKYEWIMKPKLEFN